MRGQSKPPRLPPPYRTSGDREQGRVPGCWLLAFSTCSFLSPPLSQGAPLPHHLRFTVLGSQAAARGQAPQC